MEDLDAVLEGNRKAVDDLIAAAEQSAAVWTRPRAPGKWSPSQVVEHVARSLEESATVVSGGSSKFPAVPAFARPLVRALLFRRVLKNGVFPRARTAKAFDPAVGPATPAEARARLDAALVRFDRACRARVTRDQQVATSTFGTVSVAEYAKFQALHTSHHCRQMPNTG